MDEDVLLVENCNLEREYIAKIIDTTYFNEGLTKALQEIKSDYLCTPIEYETTPQRTLLIFDKYQTLDEIIMHTGLSLKEILLIGSNISSALFSLSTIGLSHMDVKHSNILVNDGHYMLCDLCYSTNYDRFYAGKKRKLQPTHIDSEMLTNMLVEMLAPAQETSIRNISKKIKSLRLSDIEELPYEFNELLNNDALFTSRYLFAVSDEDFDDYFFEATELIGKSGSILNNKIKKRTVIKPEKRINEHFRKDSDSSSDSPNKKQFRQKNNASKRPNNKQFRQTGKMVSKINPKYFLLWITIIVVGVAVIYEINNRKEASIVRETNALEATLPEMVLLSDKKLSSIPDLSEYNNPVEIYASDNQINDISAIKDLNTVKILVLSNNPLTNINDCKSLKTLTFLDLSNTGVTTILPLMNLDSLTTLNILGCNVPQKEVERFMDTHPNCTLIYS
ncbi:MAG: hypothetical protein K6G11_10060 [Lachnospiraceae bacterium]|nr:hypothetical protein [Lachnospiraceae bacterium]